MVEAGRTSLEVLIRIEPGKDGRADRARVVEVNGKK